ncbi:beta-xylanase [Bacteroidia bacterium]|nr:beta-xylanase [Bacteroidia bacterium]
MKLSKLYPLFFLAGGLSLLLSACSAPEPTTLKDAYAGKFLIGAAINTHISSGRDTASIRVLRAEFNSVTPENCMKSENLQPEKGVFFFDDADQYVKFGEENGMTVIGHCLIWHSQAPEWFFTDENGQDVSREELIQRMKDHITTVVSRYKGKIKGWDVVNEAILDDGSWRESKFYQIIGEDFIQLAFEFARTADPDCELYYNDYSMANEGKRTGVVNMIKNIQAQGVQVDGIGMQGHCGLKFPDLNEFEKSLTAFSGLGCRVNITELDFTVLPGFDPSVGADVAASFEYQQSLNPYADGLPEAVESQLYSRYKDLFGLLLKHQDKIDRVTLWGITDDASWRNDWPIKGRTDYALLFDRNYQPKPVVKELVNLANNSPR